MKINVILSMLTIGVQSSTKSVDHQVSDKDPLRVDAFPIRCTLTSHTQSTTNKIPDMRDSTIKLFSRDKALERVKKHLNTRFLGDDRM